MKINYNRLKELNKESLAGHGANYDNTITGDNNVLNITPRMETMPCFYVVQNLVEKLVYGETIPPISLNLLVDLGIVELPTEDRKKIVEPFKMDMGNDRPQSN